ncbi:MAG TPA: CBS domain-containing protein [Armatimonadota bacterium]
MEKTAADVMARTVVTVSPTTSVRDVAALLAEKRFGAVPVIDAEGHVLGLVTEEDMVTRAARLHLPRHLTFLGGIVYLENPQHFTEEAEKILAITAEEIMDTAVPTVRPDMPVTTIATRMLDEDLRRLLVLDEQGRLLGVITRADMVRLVLSGDQLPDEPA